jgi:hypothetical protein
VIAWFEPRFLLGLTATPERTDGADLLTLCGDNLVYRCDVAEGEISADRPTPLLTCTRFIGQRETRWLRRRCAPQLRAVAGQSSQ